MEVSYEREQSGQTTIAVQVPVEKVDEVYHKAIKDLKRHVNVPGFRPGRVPPKMVESVIGRERILEYAQDLLRDQVYPEALAELPHLVPLDEPDLTLDKLALGQTANLSAKVRTAEVTLGEWQGQSVERYKAVVTDDEVNAQLQREYENNADFTDADHEDVRDGDQVVFTLRIVRDGVLVDEYGSDNPLRVEIGHNHLNPSIDDDLKGLSVGQDSVFEVNYPADYENEELADTTAEFAVQILAVQTRESLAAWIKRAGDFDELDQARAVVSESITVQRLEQSRLRARETAVRQLVENSTIDVPRADIDAAIMEELEEMEENLRGRGVDDETVDTVMERETPLVRQRVEFERKRELVLSALAQAEQVRVEQDDLAREIGMMAQLNRVEPRVLMKRLEAQGTLGQVVRNARIRKAAELLLSAAEVIDVDPPAVDAAAHHHHDHDHDHEHDHAHDHGSVEPADVAAAELDESTIEPEDEPCP